MQGNVCPPIRVCSASSHRQDIGCLGTCGLIKAQKSVRNVTGCLQGAELLRGQHASIKTICACPDIVTAAISGG